MVRKIVDFPEELARKARHVAADEDCRFGQIVVKALDAYIRERIPLKDG